MWHCAVNGHVLNPDVGDSDGGAGEYGCMLDRREKGRRWGQAVSRVPRAGRGDVALL